MFSPGKRNGPHAESPELTEFSRAGRRAAECFASRAQPRCRSAVAAGNIPDFPRGCGNEMDMERGRGPSAFFRGGMRIGRCPPWRTGSSGQHHLMRDRENHRPAPRAR